MRDKLIEATLKNGKEVVKMYGSLQEMQKMNGDD